MIHTADTEPTGAGRLKYILPGPWQHRPGPWFWSSRELSARCMPFMFPPAIASRVVGKAAKPKTLDYRCFIQFHESPICTSKAERVGFQAATRWWVPPNG